MKFFLHLVTYILKIFVNKGVGDKSSIFKQKHHYLDIVQND